MTDVSPIPAAAPPAPVPGGRPAITSFDIVVSCVVLFGFAVAQPLLDLLGRNAEFFVARRAPRSEIVATALLLAVVFPIVLGLLVVGVGRIHQATGRILLWIVLTALAAVLVVQVIGHTPLDRLPGWLQIVLALVVGGLFTLAFHRSSSLRWVIRFGIITPLLFLGLFLFGSPVSKLVFDTPAEASARVDVGNPAPVVMLVFDEFPVASLMDADGDLQDELYPNFARLRDDGTWYRNATTVQQQTVAAVPAILTGVDPPEDKLPMASDHPNSLFALLSGSHDVTAYEPVTEMCPDYACTDRTEPEASTVDRWRSLSSDLAVISGHLFLPEDLTGGLPAIDHSWSNFVEGQEAVEDYDIVSRFNQRVREDRRIEVDRFIDGLGESTGSRPTFDYLHVLYPHFPWNHHPSGQTYSTPVPYPASVTTGWGSDVWLTDQVYAQHLVQVQYVDSIVGRVIDELEAAGVYDDTLLVVVADHGIAVRPDIVHRRVARPDTIGDVAAVPLFIKPPSRTVGTVDDYRALTVDVLPTVADLLDIDLPWDVDGTSLESTDRPARTSTQITGAEGVVTFGVDGSQARAIAARKIDHFGENGPYGLAPPGHADLIGMAVDTLDVEPAGAVRGRINNAAAYEDVDLTADHLPTTVTGVVEGDRGTVDRVVAVVVNGEIAAVTRTYEAEDGSRSFYALLPPEAYRQGRNVVELLLVDGSGAARTLGDLDG